MKKIMHKRRLSLWAGVMLLSALALLPGVAQAAKNPADFPVGCQFGSEENYKNMTGPVPVTVRLFPEQINLNKDTPAGVIYQTSLPPLDYTCNVGSSSVYKLTLQQSDGFKGYLESQLNHAGLTVRFTINGKQFTLANNAQEVIGTFGNPGFNSGQITGTVELLYDGSVKAPLDISFAPTKDIINLTAGLKVGPYSYLSLGTSNATQIYYVPKCIGKTSVPAAVDLGRVITGGKGSLPSPRNFYIKPSFNQDCDGLNDISTWDKFTLALEIQFSAAGGGKLSADGKGIVLKNNDNQENGLKLVIKEAGSTPVTFDSWSKIGPAISVANSPLNLHYTASLEPATPGGVTSAVTGKFSQPVTVKVHYQ
ncbi:TPA: hypothetical protein ACIBLQ_004306 [Salmonella enterica subsp. enterica serovar Birkenhead]